MIVLREVIGSELRRLRKQQGRTLRDVSGAAKVSLGYLSEVERGQKEASSELLAAICEALGAPLSVVLSDAARHVARLEQPLHRRRDVVGQVVLRPDPRWNPVRVSAGSSGSSTAPVAPAPR